MSRSPTYDIPKEELARKYLDEGLSIEECADYFGCSTKPIEDRLRRYDLPVRNPGNQPLEVPKEQLYQWYVDDSLTTREIANKLDCHPSTVSKKLKQEEIPTTGPNHGRSLPIPKDDLIKSYVDDGRTTYQLAERFNCDPSVIERRLRWYGIETRHTSTGEGDGNYRYGSNWTRQRRKALDRAGYCCERCGLTQAEHRERYRDPTRDVPLGLDVHHRVRLALFARWELPDVEDANQLSNL